MDKSLKTEFQSCDVLTDNLLCRIADLIVSVPALGDLPKRCEPYLTEGKPDIVIDAGSLRPDVYEKLSESDNYYLESGFSFYRQLLSFDGMMLHSSAVITGGYAYLFSGPCGIGKSTHTDMWCSSFTDAVIINDDKPALRRVNGVWTAYGTPWCGKDGINTNISAPIAGICFLHRGDTVLRRLDVPQALPQFLRQTIGRRTADEAALLMPLLDSFMREIPIFEFYNHAQPGDEQLSYNAMHDAIGGKV